MESYNQNNRLRENISVFGEQRLSYVRILNLNLIKGTDNTNTWESFKSFSNS
jgi:hypothetical protein